MRPGTVYVFLQFTAIIILLYYTNFGLLGWTISFQLVAIAIALWAVWELKKSKLSVFPELKEGAQLITTGPYHILRHPMYSALILFFIPTVLVGTSSRPILIYFILLITLILKMKYEEKILRNYFSEYEQYARKSYYVIPFVF